MSSANVRPLNVEMGSNVQGMLFRAGGSRLQPTVACDTTLKRLLSYVLNSYATRGFLVQLKGWTPVLVRILLCRPLLAVHV